MTTQVVSGGTAARRAVPRPARNRLGHRWPVLLIAFCLTVAGGITLLPSPPSQAITPSLSIELTDNSPEGNSRINDPVTFTAAVSSNVDGPIDWYVEFRGTGDGGWSSGPIEASGGQAAYTRTSSVAQTETVTAEIVTPGCGAVIDTVEHQWWVPELAVTANNARTAVGQQFTQTATLTRNGQPVAGSRLRFTVTNVETGLQREFFDTTSDSGEATATWVENEEALEVVEIEETVANGGFFRTTHVWTEGNTGGYVLTVSATPASQRAGGEFEATATLTQNGTAAEEATVEYYSVLTNDWEALTTDGDGEVSVGFTSSEGSPRFGGIAFRSVNTGIVTTTVEHWLPTLTITTPDSTTITGDSYAPTAVLTHDGIPVPGVSLTLTSNNGGLPTPPEVTTGPDGRAAFPGWTRDAASVEAIVVDEPEGVEGRASARAIHTWLEDLTAPVTVDLEPSATPIRVGSPITLTATVAIAGSDEPPEDWDVNFRRYDGEEFDPVASDPTDSDGTARTDVTRDQAGGDTYLAQVELAGPGTSGCRFASESIGVSWWSTTLTLTPVDATSPARQPVAFTATLTGRVEEDSVAIEDQPLRFTLRSTDCGLPVETESAVTNDDGIATVTFSRDGPSLDTVTVEEVGVFDPALAVTTHTWGAPEPPPVSVALAQSSADSRVGTRATLTATVADTDRPGGRAGAGVPVTFLGVDPRSGGPAQTGPDGRARLPITGDNPGTDTVRAAVPFGCDVVVSPPVSHEWWLPELTVSPAEATSETGTTARLGARLTHDGQGISGATIDFSADHDGVGQATIDRRRRTDQDGRVEFRWGRTLPGLDTITVTERARVDPRRATARHTWTSRPALSVEAGPDGTTGMVDSAFRVDTITRLGTDAVTGARVNLRATMPGQPAEDHTAFTVDGNAGFSWTRPEPGIETIAITTTFAGQTVNRTLVRTWVEAAGPPPVITLSPDRTSSPVGTSFTATARVLVDGEPVSGGVRVDFVARMAGQPDEAGAADTGPDGTAGFTYSRALAGTDAITATATVDGTTVTARVSHRWTAETTEDTGGGPSEPPGGTDVKGPEVGRPGGDISVNGVGCRAGQAVRIFLGDAELGRTSAGADGNFSLRAPVPNLPLGRYLLRSSCGVTLGDPLVDLTEPQVNRGVAGVAAVGATTAATFLFFLLIIKALVSFMPGRPG